MASHGGGGGCGSLACCEPQLPGPAPAVAAVANDYAVAAARDQQEQETEQQCNVARSSITLRWKPYFQRGLMDSKLDNHRLKWADSLPKRVMAVKKPDPSLLPAFVELLTHLVDDLNLDVLVESGCVPECLAAAGPRSGFERVAARLRTFLYAAESPCGGFTDRTVDLVVCLGGDGSLVYANNLFQTDMPPILAFHQAGSLGLLSPHRFENFREDLSSVLASRSYFIMRSRLACRLHRAATGAVELKQVLNEVVIDRGPSGSLCVLDLVIEDQTVTTVQGDGLIVSSPSGSTAYAMAAGANMLHPSVPAMLVAPVCPHSLSFRPVILPASASITVRPAHGARGTAWISFDGRDRQELLPDDSISITTSEFMVPSVSARSPLQDWFSGLADCFHWNVRSAQQQNRSVRDASPALGNQAC